ncbi:MAG: hypothetical protein ACU0B7_09405 [Paracoccaceae bacterium]|uniref:hypothetical protein n=1 Tax=Seohaeicola saemankumensis TaxID=481181 RepID=UPI001E373F3C|nr:hypothetical protein [Seohaeicola saemankumensis]MCD1626199.1 hypothetical protein [Seohaeicola saemankumensis]
MSLPRLLLAILVMAGLSACASIPDPSQSMSDTEITAKVYRHDGPPALTLFTMVNNSNGSGAHTSLMVNGSQRVIFDPAGSFRHPRIATRNDTVFGITPVMEDTYTRFHARKTFHVIVQHVEVPPETAEYILRRVVASGPVPRAQCALSTAELLRDAPGLNGAIRSTWFPNNLAAQFGELPGATTQRLYEYDDADRFKALDVFDADRVRASQEAKADE